MYLNAADSNVISGNYIGFDANGSIVLSSSSEAIFVDGVGNQIGGTTAGERNLIASPGTGIRVTGGGSNNILGNWIGIDASGLVAFPPFEGIRIHIGGPSPGEGNVVSGWGDTGVAIDSDAIVQGNLVGTDITGTLSLGNGTGLQVFGGIVTIGGAAAGAGNVVSANLMDGVAVSPATVVIEGNLIGTDIGGVFALGNGAHGININGGQVTVGGLAPGTANVIAFNVGAGVRSSFAPGALSIEGNSIFSNLGLGIDLAAAGVSPNDPGDVDATTNFPTLSLAGAGAMALLEGDLAGQPNLNHRIELFASSGVIPLETEKASASWAPRAC